MKMKKTYTYSDARQKLSMVLDEVEKYGEVRIRRRDGSVFVVSKETKRKSPLDVPPITDVQISLEEIIDVIREGRERDYTSPKPEEKDEEE